MIDFFLHKNGEVKFLVIERQRERESFTSLASRKCGAGRFDAK